MCGAGGRRPRGRGSLAALAGMLVALYLATKDRLSYKGATEYFQSQEKRPEVQKQLVGFVEKWHGKAVAGENNSLKEQDTPTGGDGLSEARKFVEALSVHGETQVPSGKKGIYALLDEK